MALTEATRVRLDSEQRKKLDIVCSVLGLTGSDVIRSALDTELGRLLANNRAALEAVIAAKEEELRILRERLG